MRQRETENGERLMAFDLDLERPWSMFDPHDHLVIGLLHAVADAVIVGNETLQAVSQEHSWTADYIYPALVSA
jgi:hypothetical protein